MPNLNERFIVAQTESGYRPRGNLIEAWNCKEHEFIVSGAAETGKTFCLLNRLHLLCCLYPNISALMVRKTYSSIKNSVAETYENKILPSKDVVQIYGGSRVEKYIYPNGSVIWVGGMDNPDKVLSSERDYIYVNQAEELNRAEWEVLLTRVTGRAGNAPFPQIFGDCNPSHPSHWIRKRELDGTLKVIHTTHRDNPTLYDDNGNLTERGKRTIEVLSRLSGARKARLFYGQWAAPEGAIYDVFDEQKHIVEDFNIPRMWARVVGVDPVGMLSAAVWLAYDPENERLVVYREYYEPSGRSTLEHVRNVLDMTGSEPVVGWCGGGPSETQQRIDWNAAGIPLVKPSTSDVWSQIDKVYQLFENGSLVVMKSCENLITEIGMYRRRLNDDALTDVIEDKESFHLLDALRYAVDWLAGDHAIMRITYNPMPMMDY